MAFEDSTDPDSLSTRLADLAERARDRFAAEIRAGRHPRIEEYLGGLGGPTREAVLRALIAEERDRAGDRGGLPEARTYRDRFRADKALIDDLFGPAESTATMPPRDHAGLDSGLLVGEPTCPGHRYEILRYHARGGLGVVSLARDSELHREVALKEIRPDCADHPEYRARFLREAEVTGRLEHPGIVPVHGIGHHDDGRPYYIMRFIRGETLKDAIARLREVARPGDRRLGLHALVGRFIDACHAVAYAHSRKVLHRDLKPGNIMLGPFGETLVVDWGLAKTFDGPIVDESSEEGSLRPESDSGVTPTKLGSEIGTTGYMSPEQAAGLLGELGPTSDVYSLGATLHCLVTGHPPFEGAGKEEFLRRAREGDFPRPRKVEPSVPPALEAICLKAMALRPVDRYQSAEALAEDLDRWRAGEPVLAHPEPTVDRLARWARRHKTALAGAAVLLVSTTIGLAVFAAQERRKSEQIAVEKASAQGDLKLTRGSLRGIMEGLTGPELTYLPHTGPPRLNLAGQVLEFHRDLIQKHPDDPDVRFELAHACQVVANIGRSMGRRDPAAKLYDEAIGLLRKLLVDDPGSDDYRLGLASVLVDSGEHSRMAGRPRAAEPEYLQALDVLGDHDGPPADERYRRTRAMALIDLAASRVETGRPLEARPGAFEAVEILSTLADKPRNRKSDRLLVIYALSARADTLRASGEPKRARIDLSEAYKQARELQKAWDNTDSRYALAMIENQQGRLSSESSDPAQAETWFNASFSILATLWKKNQRIPFMERELAFALNGRGGARLATLGAGPDPKAKALGLALLDCEKARENLDPLVDGWPGHYDYQGLFGQSLANLGRIALAQGDPKKAKELLGQAIDRHRSALRANPESPDDKLLEASIRDELKAIESRITISSSP